MPTYLTETLFPAVLNMSVTASIVILFVLGIRLLMKRVPKVFSYALWGVVLFRLLCPVSITADFALLSITDSEAAPVTQHTSTVEHIPQSTVTTLLPDVTIPAPNNGALSTSPTVPSTDPTDTPDPEPQLPTTPSTPQTPDTPNEPAVSVAGIACAVWLVGIAAMIGYSLWSFLRLRRRLIGAVRLRQNIYLADHIASPFVLGLIRAKIYLPSSLSEQEQRYILLHEQHHIRRLDHIAKALAFLALCIHWFNPLVWLAFILSGKDMEMSCDEAVMKKMGADIRREYSASLLSLTTGRRMIAGTPLAFGEGDTGSRIRNILNWKKPRTRIILLAAIICTAVILFCAVNPATAPEDSEPPEQTDEDPGIETPPPCDHQSFTIAFDSQPTRFTVVDWFYDNDLLSQCSICGENPLAEYTQTSFSDCLDGLKNGKYDVVLLPCSSDMLASLEGYTVVPVQRDAVIFVRSNTADQLGYNLSDEEIRRAFTSGETVYWDAAGTDPIIPATGARDSATIWQQIYRLFGFSPTSDNVVVTGENHDNAPMAIADSGRTGSGLWPYYFSCRSGEAALNGEPIAVNGVYPSVQSIVDGSYPYAFTYYAVYAPDNAHASEISDFVSYIQLLKYSLFETSDTLRFIQLAQERSFNREDEEFSLVGLYEDTERSVVVNGLLIQTLYALYDQLELPRDPDTLDLLPVGISIEIQTTYRRSIRIYPCAEAPYVCLFLNTATSQEVSEVYSPQLYLYLTALGEKENATLADPDNDGFFEAFLWDYRAHDLIIYDYYDDEIHRISTNESLGCAASDYTGLIANVLPRYNNMIQAQDESGAVHVYQYRDGTFSYVCPISTALGQEPVNTALTEDELAYFEDLFTVGRPFSQMLLSCEYTAPEGIDLAMVFREGVPGELNGMWGYTIYESERDALREAMGSAYRDDCEKIPRSVMDDLLTQYLGLNLKDTQGIGLEQFTYLEQFDAYYICCSTTSRVVPDFHSGIRRSDGLIELQYQKKTAASSTNPNSTHVLLLRQTGDSYQLVANLRTLRPGMTFEPYSVSTRDFTVNELSESESAQVNAILQDFFTLHAASLAGAEPDPAERIDPTLDQYVRRCAEVFRGGYADNGNNLLRCSTHYELIRSQYGGEQLILSIRETAELYYSPNNWVTPVFTSSHISLDHVLLFIKAEDGGFTLATQMNDMRYVHYYPASGSVLSGTEDGSFTASQPDMLPTVAYSRIADGFLYAESGGSVWAINNGVPVQRSFDYWTIPLTHNGWELSVFYGWTKHANVLAATSNGSADYSVIPIPGSSRYLKLVLNGGYTYLIDTDTGTIQDPLAALGEDALIRLHSVSFSPDGQYAVVSHHSATVCVLLNCATGEITQLPYASDLYSVSGAFVDEETIILISAFEVDAPHEIEYRIARYHIPTGTLTEYPGQYTAKDRSASNFLVFSDSHQFAYTFEDGRLVIVDPLTFERTATQISSTDVQSVFYCPNCLAGVICNGVVYILDYDGNAHAVCRTA